MSEPTREKIETLAKFCGLDLQIGEGSFDVDLNGRVLATGETWNPFTDSNDERMVLEAAREWPAWKLRYVKVNTYKDTLAQSFDRWFWKFSKVGDISEAVYLALQNQAIKTESEQSHEQLNN